MMSLAVGFFVFGVTMVVWLAMGHLFTLSLDDGEPERDWGGDWADLARDFAYDQDCWCTVVVAMLSQAWRGVEYFDLQEQLRAALSTNTARTSKLRFASMSSIQRLIQSTMYRLPSIRFVKLATCMFGGALAGSTLLAAMREARCCQAVLRNYASNRVVT
jgi:hypothetical protein